MTFSKFILLISFVLLFVSCAKLPVDPPVVMPVVTVDRPVLMLKDMMEQGLPSPYYHFEYNDSGYITKAVFASGLSFYDLSYTGGVIDKMFMNKDVPVDIKKDILVYVYNNGKLTGVDVYDKNGLLYRKCLLTFTLSRQLQLLEWDVRENNGNFIKEETLQFSYFANGNLEKLRYQSFPVGPQIASVHEDRFDDYDDKPNVDGFTLLHVNPFFLDLLLLPSVHLQQNNPGKVTRTGDGENYQINYSYTYDQQKRPLTKNGDFSYTTGAEAGLHVNTLTTFSYNK